MLSLVIRTLCNPSNRAVTSRTFFSQFQAKDEWITTDVTGLQKQKFSLDITDENPKFAKEQLYIPQLHNSVLPFCFPVLSTLTDFACVPFTRCWIGIQWLSCQNLCPFTLYIARPTFRFHWAFLVRQMLMSWSYSFDFSFLVNWKTLGNFTIDTNRVVLVTSGCWLLCSSGFIQLQNQSNSPLNRLQTSSDH